MFHLPDFWGFLLPPVFLVCESADVASADRRQKININLTIFKQQEP
jgi:hypothetical protein